MYDVRDRESFDSAQILLKDLQQKGKISDCFLGKICLNMFIWFDFKKGDNEEEKVLPLTRRLARDIWHKTIGFSMGCFKLLLDFFELLWELRIPYPGIPGFTA